MYKQMKQILLVFTVLFLMVIPFCVPSAHAAADEEVTITSVTVDDVKFMEGTHCHYVDQYEDEEGTHAAYWKYDVSISKITVTTSDGQEYSGYPSDVAYNMYYDGGYSHYPSYSVSDDQSSENQWGAGIHTAQLTFDDVTVDFNVEIVETPIENIEISDIHLMEENNGYWDTYYYSDENGNELKKEFYRYYWSLDSITVTTKDGQTFTGSPYSVCYQLRSTYGYDFSYGNDVTQSGANPWMPGQIITGNFTINNINRAEFRIIIDENPIESITADDVKLLEENNGYWDTYTYVDDEGNTVEKQFYRYYFSVSRIAVTTKDGKAFEGSPYEVQQNLYDEYGYYFSYGTRSEQSGSNPWKVGVNKGTFYLGNKTADVNVIIIENPVQTIEVDDYHTMVESNGYWNSYYEEDEQGNSVEHRYFKYYIEARNITVTTKDGDSFTGDPDKVCSAMRNKYGVSFNYNVSSVQDKDHQWKVGTNLAQFSLGNTTVDFNVIVEEVPIVSIEADDVKVVENTRGSIYTYTEDGVQKDYYHYYTFCNRVTVTDKDGVVHKGDLYDVCDQLRRKYGFSFNYSVIDTQSEKNQWKVGANIAKLKIGNMEAEYNFIVIENPVESIQIADMITVEGMNCYEYSEGGYDENGNYVSHKYLYYELGPNKLIVTDKDGTQFKGSPWNVTDQLSKKYGAEFSYNTRSDQSYENQWGAGTHKATFLICNKAAEYNYIIMENPITSITVEDRTFVEGMNCDIREYYDDNNEVQEYYYYYVSPETVTVTTSDGESHKGDVWDVSSWLQKKYGAQFSYSYDSDQSYQNQWGIGAHKATIRYGFVSADYNITIIKNPVESISADDVTVLEGTRCYIRNSSQWNEETGEYDQLQMEYYELFVNKVTVTTDDGEVFTGMVDKVLRNLSAKYKVDFSYRLSSDQSFDNVWGVGTNQATINMGRISGQYNYVIVKSPISSLTAEDIKYVELTNGSQNYVSDYDENGVQVRKYYYFYNYRTGIIAVTTDDGEIFTGETNDVCNKLREKYGYSFSNDVRPIDQQDYENQWGLGAHKAELQIGKVSAEFNYVIIENPVDYMVVSDKTILENTNCYQTTEYEYDPVTGEEKTYEYQRYYAENNQVKVYCDDGTSFEGDVWYVNNQLYQKYKAYFSYNFTSDQSHDNVWGIGTHKAAYNIGKKSAEFNIHIIEAPIAAVSVDDVLIIEGTNQETFHSYEEDEYGYGSYVTYQGYVVDPSVITVTDIDGEVYSGNRYTVFRNMEQKYGCAFSYEIVTDQSSTNKWEAGTHKASLVVGSKSFDFNVTIIENPIASIEVEDVITYEDYAGISTYYLQYTSVEVPEYDVRPLKIKATAKDGRIFEGNYGNFTNWVRGYYGAIGSLKTESDQSYDNPWNVGTHQAVLKFGNVEAEYNVIVKPSVIAEIKVSDIAISAKQVDTGWGYPHFSYSVSNIVVKLVDGTEIEGAPFDAMSEIEEKYYADRSQYGNNISIYSFDDQSSSNVWDIGKHKATYRLGIHKCDFTVEIVEELIANVDIKKLVLLEGDTGFRVEDEHRYRFYEVSPLNLEITLFNGQKFSGRLSDVINDIYKNTGTWLDYQVTSDQRYDNEWKKGSHTAAITLETKKYDYPVEIIGNTIAKVTQAEVTAIEGCQGRLIAWKPDNGYYLPDYYRYNENPYEINLTVTMKDGTVFNGSTEKVRDDMLKKYGYQIYAVYFYSDQSDANKWSTGKHTAHLSAGGVKGDYTINIVKNPVRSIYTDDIFHAVDDCSIYYDYDTETAVEVSYCYYSYYPEEVTVTLDDGTSIKGTTGEINQQLGQRYKAFFYTNMNAIQDYKHQWSEGTHYVTISIGQVKYTYKVIIGQESECSHDYTIEYKWDNDYSTVTGSAVCKKCGHLIEEIVRTETVSITPPTCTEKGEGVYRAVFNNSLFTTQEKKAVLEPTGHEWTLKEWTWADDFSSATASFVCAHDSKHTKNLTDKQPVETEVKAATCTENAVYNYLAKVTLDNETYSDLKENVVKEGSALGHQYEYLGITWREDNTAYAEFECQRDHDKVTEECTVVIKDSTATCTESGTTVFEATITFEEKTYSDTKTVEGEALGHDWSVEWNWSEDYSTAEAIFTCQRDNSHQETVEATVTVEETNKAITYTATVTFEGVTYQDVKKVSTQEVIRIYGDNRYETSLKTAEELRSVLGVDKFDAVVLTTGSDFADALSGSYLANKNKAPVILIRDNAKKTPYLDNVINYIKEHVKANGTVYVLGGVNAVPEEWLTGLAGYKVTRLEGSNRYTTNIEVLNEVGYTGGDILVCTGKDFADSLSASAVDLPILLVNGTGSLSKTQKSYLESLSNVKFHIIGGEAAVSKDIETALASYGTVVERIAGGARYETSKLIAERFFSEPDKAVLAYGHNFPDGLGGGALAYAMKSPLILAGSSKSRSRFAIEYCTGKGITSGYVLGGSGLISDEYVKEIFDLSAEDIIIEK